MKKYKIWILLAAMIALVRVEHTGTDISDLEPVSLVKISLEDHTVRVQTDTGAEGVGRDLDEALTDLHTSASAEVFLETAEYLLVNETGAALIPQVYNILRPTCQVCMISGEGDLEDVADFLNIHSPDKTLLRCRAGMTDLPRLRYENGRGYLEQGNNQS